MKEQNFFRDKREGREYNRESIRHKRKEKVAVWRACDGKRIRGGCLNRDRRSGGRDGL